VKFLVDNQLPRALVTLLENFGHRAVHVLDIELAARTGLEPVHRP
jgi:predicted nuclease of predicted toxin-antitoxin system